VCLVKGTNRKTVQLWRRERVTATRPGLSDQY
jgi:hypothetical protein